MKILETIGRDNIAKVYIGLTNSGKVVEFVESFPTGNVNDKWVIIVSTMYGCPVGCKMCDAGMFYKGVLNFEEIAEQVEYCVDNRFKGNIKTRRFKIQFARMGEPSFNMNVIRALEYFSRKYPTFYPSISTVAPKSKFCTEFFDNLLDIKKRLFPLNFQLQFSIHTTDERLRGSLIPIKTWSFKEMADYGIRFYDKGGKKITLNFALAKENVVDADVISKYFPKEYFLIKITPLNPTINVRKNNLSNDVNIKTGFPEKHRNFIEKLKRLGYDVILAVNRYEEEENTIGSNCGQLIISKHLSVLHLKHKAR